jgi:tetratricopeptide (TPR) repeat protein
MHHMSHFYVIRLVLLCTVPLLTVLFAGISAQENPAHNKVPPWQRVLKGADAKRVKELEKSIQELRQAGRYTEAQAAARTIVEIRSRIQGEAHWQTSDALRTLRTLEHVAALPTEAQAELAHVRKLDTEASRLHQRGNHAEGVPLLQRALEIRRRHLGPEHTEVANAMNDLAFFLWRSGKYAEAEPLFRQALATRRKLLGEDHPDTATGYNNLAANLDDQGKYVEAESLYRQALAIDRKLLGEDHLATANRYNNLAMTLHAQGKYAEAEPLLKKALATARKLLGEDRLETVTSYNNLAMNLNAQGKYAEAEPLLKKALAARRKLVGEDHPDTATAYNNLAVNLDDQGKYAEAEPLFHQVLATRRKVLGESHPLTATSYNNLAVNLDGQGKYVEAEPLFQKALATRRKVLGEDHPETVSSYNNLASNLDGQGKYALAEPLYRGALATRRKVLGEDHPLTATAYNNLAVNLDDQGKYAQAEPLYRQALATRRKVLGEDHPDTVLSYNNLAVNLDDQGKYAQAEPLYRQALATRRKLLGEEHPKMATSYNNLAENLHDQGKYAEAVPLYRQGLAIRRKLLGEDHPLTAQSYNNMAANLADQGKYAEAEPLHQKALATRRKLLGEDHPDTAQSYSNVAYNWNAQGRYAEAEPLWVRATHTFEVARWRSSRTGLERASATVPSPFPYLAACRARLGQPVEAWRALEAALARGLLDDLSAARTQALNAEELKRLDGLNTSLDWLNRQITTLLTSKEQNEADKARYRELAAQRQKVIAELDSFASDRAARAVYDLQRIQALLPADTALIAWVDLRGSPNAVPSGGEHWACVIRRTGTPVWVPLPGSGTLGQWTEEDGELPRQLRLAVAQPPNQNRQDWQESVRQATAQRLTQVEPHLQGVRQLVVLSAWTMAGLPIEALSERYTVSYAPSATLFARLQEQRQNLLASANDRPARNSRILALGDPLFSSAVLERAELKVFPPDDGVLLTQVAAGSNAAQSGLKPDDVLLAYAGTQLKNPAQLPTAIEAQQKASATGKEETTVSVPVQIWRAGKVLNRVVRPGALGVQFAQRPAGEVLQVKHAGDRAVQSSRGTPFAPLPGTRIEAESIARLLPEPVLLLGSEANVGRLEQLADQEQLRQFRYLHLATHGVANNRIALYSALILAPDQPPNLAQPSDGASPLPYGWLTAEAILKNWKLDADLVVLSACQSAIGKYAGGEGYLGFAQALFLAGARSLVLSLWKVDDTATALLMVRFYQNFLGKRAGLTQPMSKAEALREAKHWLRNLTATEVEELQQQLQRREIGPTRPRPTEDAEMVERPYAHPYYWSAFILIGDPS